MPVAIFAGQPTAETEARLGDALHVVSDGFRGEFVSVHVALPDTAIRSTVFELDELPKSEDMRNALLRWRFAKEWQRPEDSLDCRGFDLGGDCGKRLFFGQAGDRLWLECVRRALVQARIMPWSLNAAAAYRFNFFHDAVSDGGGALLSLDPDCWNLLLWDDKRRFRQVLTRLRENAGAADEAASVADEVERAILAYVLGEDSRRVGRLHLAGSESDIAALAEIFEGRLNERAVLLNVGEGISGVVAGMRDGLAPLALAAALSS
jgi:hypothetical protein